MKCPVCKLDMLENINLADDLPAKECASGHGVWVSSNEYLAWRP